MKIIKCSELKNNFDFNQLSKMQPSFLNLTRALMLQTYVSM